MISKIRQLCLFAAISQNNFTFSFVIAICVLVLQIDNQHFGNDYETHIETYHYIIGGNRSSTDIITKMQIEFRTTKQDYDSFLKFYFFKWDLAKRLLLLIIFSLLFGSFGETRNSFNLSVFLLKSSAVAIILFILFVLIPYIIAKVKFRKTLSKHPFIKSRIISTNDEGIIVTTENENTFWNWETLSKAEIVNDYLFVSLFTNKFYLIPLSSFSSNNEAINFLGVLKNGIQKVRGTNKNRKIRNLYYWGLVGFIPNFGVIAGIILLIKGFQYNKTTLILIGAGDILFTIFFWMVLSPILDPKGLTDVSQMQLNTLVKNVEFYKLQHGQYPDSLQLLLQDDEFAPVNDPIQLDHHRKNTYYNYRRVGDKYILFSSGEDGIPDTKDDLFPQLVFSDSSKIGLIRSK
jgi:hypothetical protein